MAEASKAPAAKSQAKEGDNVLDTVMAHLKRAFDWMDKVTDDDTKAVVMEKAFEFLENALIDKYDVRLVKEDEASDSAHDERAKPTPNDDELNKLKENDGPMGYDLNALIRGMGWSKRPTMFESDAERLQELQGVPVGEVANSNVNARDTARFLVGRMVIQDDRIREEITDILTAGLNLYVRDPKAWQRGESQ